MYSGTFFTPWELKQGSPAPRPVRNQAAWQEVSSRQISIAPHSLHYCLNQTIYLTPTGEKLSATKPDPGPKKVGDHWAKEFIPRTKGHQKGRKITHSQVKILCSVSTIKESSFFFKTKSKYFATNSCVSPQAEQVSRSVGAAAFIIITAPHLIRQELVSENRGARNVFADCLSRAGSHPVVGLSATFTPVLR